MDLIIITAGPWIMIDAAQIREIKQVRKIIRQEVRHFALSFLRIYHCGSQPLRPGRRRFLLKKEFPVNSVWISFQNQRAILQERKNVRGDTKEVEQKLVLAKI